MGATIHIKKAMLDKGKKSGDIAESLGTDKQVFYNKLSRDKMSYEDAEKIADILGCEVLLVDRETGRTY